MNTATLLTKKTYRSRRTVGSIVIFELPLLYTARLARCQVWDHIRSRGRRINQASAGPRTFAAMS